MARRRIGPRSLTVLFALAILCVGFLAMGGEGLARTAQQTASAGSASSPDQAIRIGVPLVNLYATVLDNHKALVKDLDQSDFKVFEDKVEQKIAFFSHEKTLPLSIGLLIDTSGSEQNKIEEEQKAASQFFHRVLQEGDKAFIIEFDVGAALLSNWTSDVDTLDRAIYRAAAGGGGAAQLRPEVFYPNLGGTRLYDTIYAVSLKKMADESGRKALIILTDATDQGSAKTIKQAVEAAQRADTLIQVLVVYDEKAYANFDAAKKLSEETGGRAIDIGAHNRLQKAFDQISDELRSEYSLGYYPTNSTSDGKYRQVKLEMTSKNYKILARKGYYPRAESK